MVRFPNNNVCSFKAVQDGLTFQLTEDQQTGEQHTDVKTRQLRAVMNNLSTHYRQVQLTRVSA